jgi:hypothetical protein
MREILADFTALSLAAILLFHLLMIQVFHSVLIYENNEWVLITELVLAVGLIVLSIDRILDDLNTLRR